MHHQRNFPYFSMLSPPLNSALQATRLWLFTFLLSGLVLFCWLCFDSGNQTSLTSVLGMIVYFTGLTGVLSVVTIPIAAYSFRRILRLSGLRRWLASSLLLTAPWLLVVCIVFLAFRQFFTERDNLLSHLLLFTNPCLVAAHLAAAVVYRHWLFPRSRQLEATTEEVASYD